MQPRAGETLVRVMPEAADDVDAVSSISGTADGSATAATDSPGGRVLQYAYTATWQASSLRRVSHSSLALSRLQHSMSGAGAPGSLPAGDAGRFSAAPRLGPGAGPTSTRMLVSSADTHPKKIKRVLAGAGQGGLCPQGQGGSVGRLDFQLQEDFVETQFFGAFRAHFCYWKHEDVALLVCRAACGYDVVDGTQESPGPE